jgi:hypothetical protein
MNFQIDDRAKTIAGMVKKFRRGVHQGFVYIDFSHKRSWQVKQRLNRTLGHAAL